MRPHDDSSLPGLQAQRPPPYSTLMPANLITFVHFSMASETSVPNSAGEPPTGVPPSSVIRCLILGSARAALSSLLSRSMISAGGPLGAPAPATPRVPHSG